MPPCLWTGCGARPQLNSVLSGCRQRDRRAMHNAARRAFAIFVAAHLVVSVFAGDRPTSSIRERSVVARAKTLDVRELDPSLPSEPLERYLIRSLPAHVSLEWGESTCELAAPYDDSSPLCASIRADHPNIRGELHFDVVVGTLTRGVSGPPMLHNLYLIVMKKGVRVDVIEYDSISHFGRTGFRSTRRGSTG